MRLIPLLLLVLAVAAPPLSAGEHPEHPSSGQEHPKRVKKKRRKKKSKWVRNRKVMAAFAQAVEDHVVLKQEDEGSFRIRDKRLKKTWNLQLDRIHKKRIARLGEHEFFACADFDSVDSDHKLDLDFFVSRSGRSFIVDEVAIHKVNGRPRYTYNSRNQRVPVRRAKKKRRRRRKTKKTRRKLEQVDPIGAGSEHPSGEQPPSSGGQEHPAGSEHPH